MPFELCVEFESLNLGFVHHTTQPLKRAYHGTRDKEPSRKRTRKFGRSGNGSSWARRHTFVKMNKVLVWYKNRICVPDVDGIKKLILGEAHDTAYSIHPGGTKMYHDLKERFGGME
ncbi:LOW QUALITY PROTEIN: hypothetical protein U9M48_039425 [Paspalum notatum var. saurae]|uniref:Uncharacterized protein n=1 Tax=Paspalum notatum var. saurae TaxID=547442 RepID=A0AAQ3XEL3_PASNO